MLACSKIKKHFALALGKTRIYNWCMKIFIKKNRVLLVLVVLIFAMILPVVLSAQQPDRFALVIGNARYVEFGELKNAHNDAADMASALNELGFEVTTLFDADLIAMEDEVLRLSSKLSASPNAIGIFYYAGHGVQSEGANYLIPADARIPGEVYLKTKALTVQAVLDSLQMSKNVLNIIILDACRDNPFSWARSGVRGLSVVASQPPGSIIVYATSAGSTALEGMGRNGVFTGELLKHLKTPNIDVMEVFKRTGASVQEATNGRQNPAVYSQFFRNVYLAAGPSAPVKQAAASATVLPAQPVVAQKLYGSSLVKTETGGTLYIDGIKVDSLRAGGQLRLSGREAGRYEYEMRYPSGEKETKSIKIEQDKEVLVSFEWKPPIPKQVLYNVASSKNGGKASADSEAAYYGTRYAYLANDDNYESFWASYNMPAWIKIEFDKVYEICKIAIKIEYHQLKYAIDLSLDGKSWQEVVSPRLSANVPARIPTYDSAGSAYETFDIPPVPAKYVRARFLTTTSPASHIFKTSISELEAYSFRSGL
jgi:hypothetical protein